MNCLAGVIVNSAGNAGAGAVVVAAVAVADVVIDIDVVMIVTRVPVDLLWALGILSVTVEWRRLCRWCVLPSNC